MAGRTARSPKTLCSTPRTSGCSRAPGRRAALSLAELGRRVGLSSPAVAERLARLERDGVIRGYHADVDPRALGYTLGAVMRIRPAPRQIADVAELARDTPEVVECHRVTGDDCFFMKRPRARRRAPRGGHRPLHALRPDDDVDHAVLARPAARAGAMSRCCIVPPTMLDRIARHGTQAQRDWALSTIALDATIRQARVQNQLLRGVRGHREGPDALAALENQSANREIRDAQGSWEVTGSPIVRREGEPPTGDAAADEAYDGLGATYDFYARGLRPQLDRRRGHAAATASCTTASDYDNAFWDGRRMVVRRRRRRAVQPVHDRRST